MTDSNKPIDPAHEVRQRVEAARNNLMAASAGSLDPAVAGHLITGAVLLLDSAVEWLEP